MLLRWQTLREVSNGSCCIGSVSYCESSCTWLSLCRPYADTRVCWRHAIPMTTLGSNDVSDLMKTRGSDNTMIIIWWHWLMTPWRSNDIMPIWWWEVLMTSCWSVNDTKVSRRHADLIRYKEQMTSSWSDDVMRTYANMAEVWWRHAAPVATGGWWFCIAWSQRARRRRAVPGAAPGRGTGTRPPAPPAGGRRGRGIRQSAGSPIYTGN